MPHLKNKVNITNKRDWEQKKNNKGRVTDRYYSNSILTWFTLGHRWRRDSVLTHAWGNPKTRSTPALPNLPACSQRIIPHQAVCFISSSQLLQCIILLFQFTLLIVSFSSFLVCIFPSCSPFLYTWFIWGCVASLMWKRVLGFRYKMWIYYVDKCELRNSLPLRWEELSSPAQSGTPGSPGGGLMLFQDPAKKQEGLTLV